MHFSKSFITNNGEKFELQMNYASGNTKGIIDISIYRQNLKVGGFSFTDSVDDPFTPDYGDKTISKEAEKIFKQFRDLCDL